MNWNDLTMAQKNELMQTYIRNGVTSLSDMRSHFNTYANGGPKKTYKEWAVQMHTKYPWLELDSNKAGYDYERYFNENYDDAVARLNEPEARHFTDKYKLPNHPTFSNESIYSRGPSYGGTWTKDNKFVPSVINTQQYPKVYDQNRAYTEEEIYDRLRHKFDEGGPKQNRYITPRFPEEYQVLPVNEEGLPYYTLPDLEVTAERLPQAKATDANIQRYANAVANGQLKLTQIPNTELRNRVRAKPIVDQIMRDRDKTLAPILMGTVGMPAAIIGGISVAPTVAAIMNNPVVDAGLTIHGAATAPRNIKEGVQEIREGEYGRGALDLGLTALDLYGAGKLYKHGKNAARRLAEVFTRQGDHLHTMNVQEAKKLLTKKETLDYVMKGGKHPELAYRTGEYSGNTMPGSGDWSHEGDVVDAFFGKPRSKEEYVRELSIEDLSPEMQKYIRENYGRKAKRIKVFDLGDVKDAASINDRDSWGLYKEIELPGQEEVKALGLKPDVDTKYVLDPGGYHHVRNEVVGDRMIHHNEDIWKYKASDYKKRRRNIFEEPNKFNVLAKDLGLRFIDTMGTPVVHTWTASTPANHPQLFSDMIKQMKLGEENIKVNQDLLNLLKNWYNIYGN